MIYGADRHHAASRDSRCHSITPDTSLMVAGVAASLMFVGLCFKVSGAPFQIWAPDVYQGAPAPVSAFMATGPKAAAFAIFLRIFLTAFDRIAVTWAPHRLGLRAGFDDHRQLRRAHAK